MKKIIRILGITLSLVFLASCSDDSPTDEPSKELSESNLKGTYIYQTVNVKEAVDLNKDGVFNNDLFKEGYKTCTLDNQLEITEKNYNFILKGSTCAPDEKNLYFTYKLDKTAKTITLFENGIESGKVDNVEFYNGNDLKTYEYQVYDSNLKQNVVFIMKAI